jgi:SAM-dependent methyltransferase
MKAANVSYGESYFKQNQPQLLNFSQIEVWHKEVIKFLQDQNHLRILDIGCGAGKTLKLLGKHDVVGIDISKFALKIASKHANVVGATADSLPFRDKSFKAVLMVDVIEHLTMKSLNKALRETSRILSKNGKLIIHTQPNGFLGKPFYFINRRRKTETGHINPLTPWEVKASLIKNGFEIATLEVKDLPKFQVFNKARIPKFLMWFLGNRTLVMGIKKHVLPSGLDESSIA